MQWLRKYGFRVVRGKCCGDERFCLCQCGHQVGRENIVASMKEHGMRVMCVGRWNEHEEAVLCLRRSAAIETRGAAPEPRLVNELDAGGSGNHEENVVRQSRCHAVK